MRPALSHKASLSFTLFATLQLAAFSANAFEISSTDDGVFVHWDSEVVTYHINAAGTNQLPFDEVQNAIVESFEAWNGHGAELKLVFGGKTDNAQHGYVKRQENQNIVVWEDNNWAYDPNALAITLTSFERSTGRLVDADIIINGADYNWSTSGEERKHDLSNSLTHEVGHFIGLGHSESKEATMFASAITGETAKRSLYNDDIRGLNFLYGGTSQALNDTWEDANIIQDNETSGFRLNDAQVHVACSTVAPGGSPMSGSPWLAAIALFAGFAFVRRARRGAAATLTLLFTAGIAAVAPQTADATTLPALSLEQVTIMSEQVALVTITEQTSEFEGGVIWTHTTARVVDCWAGDCEDTVTIRTPGGVVGDIEQRVEGITPMRPGHNMVLFLQATPQTLGQVFRPVGMALGALPVRDLGDNTVAVRDLTDLTLISKQSEPIHGEDLSFAVAINELKAFVASR